MNHNVCIGVETFYHDLEKLCKEADNVKSCKFYETLRKLFFLALNERTQSVGLSFSGPFAKMDYLVKEYKVPKDLFRSLKQFRGKVENLDRCDEEALRRHRFYDVRLFAEFLSSIYQKSVPQSLLKYLPKDYRVESERKGRPVTDVIRVSVYDWDDRLIHANTADEMGDEVDICYLFSEEEKDRFHLAGDYSYLKNFLKKDCQLNLIRPVVEKGIYYPEHIVYEPDFLVDISSVAESFEEYGLTPYSYLVKRLKPRQSTQPILIGNFAGQLLDEVVYNEREVQTVSPVTRYVKSATRFFRQNALSLVTCGDFDSKKFHQEAQHQQQNLEMYMGKQLDGFRIFDPEITLLEPSFFCEMLGVQGRMDLMHDNKRLLIEQKSGKWGYPKGHQEKHYVQMLFYLAWIKYNMHISTDEVSALLLYSKYPMEGRRLNQENGLMKESPAPKLLFSAMALRNSIAKLEESLQNGGIRILEKLTAESLNVNHVSGPLWSRYQAPEIQQVLDTVKRADPLAREYFYRFFTFLEREYHLAKSEFATAWSFSMEEKISDGMAYSGLQFDGILCSGEMGEGIDFVRFQIPEESQENLPNFRKGDIVVCYNYRAEPISMCRDIVFRATLVEQTKETLTIKLRAPQRNKNVFCKKKGSFWALEHDFLDSSFSSSFKDLFAFLSMEDEDRRNLILNLRNPRIDDSVKLSGDYGRFNELVLRAKRSEDYFLVIGPPGTGKTSFALVNILKETLTDPSTSILLVSYTNRAVEEICSKLIKENIDFIRIGHEHSCTESFDKSYLMKNKLRDLSKAEEIKLFLSQNRVYVGTTSSISSSQALFALKHFDLAIVDESSQILEPQLMSLLTAGGGKAVKKFVFIGDHKQLPAVVQQSERESRVTEEPLRKIGLIDCRSSFFERLLRLQDGNDELVCTLDHQGRMHPQVSEFVNQSYYNAMLTSVPLKHQMENRFFRELEDEDVCGLSRLEQLLVKKRMLAFHVPAEEDGSSDNVNGQEAHLIAEVVRSVWNLYQKTGKPFVTEKSVGVIVPYRAQIAMVRKELERLEIDDLSEIAVDTVERYQGSEREVIVYGTTIRKQYQLDFLSGNTFVDEKGNLIDRKLNVAITRAREQLVFVGDTKLLRESPTYASFVDYLRKKECCYGNPLNT